MQETETNKKKETEDEHNYTESKLYLFILKREQEDSAWYAEQWYMSMSNDTCIY